MSIELSSFKPFSGGEGGGGAGEKSQLNVSKQFFLEAQCESFLIEQLLLQ